MEGLAIYWNCNSVMYAHLPKAELLQRFLEGIATKTVTPTNYNYSKKCFICNNIYFFTIASVCKKKHQQSNFLIIYEIDVSCFIKLDILQKIKVNYYKTFQICKEK